MSSTDPAAASGAEPTPAPDQPTAPLPPPPPPASGGPAAPPPPQAPAGSSWSEAPAGSTWSAAAGQPPQPAPPAYPAPGGYPSAYPPPAPYPYAAAPPAAAPTDDKAVWAMVLAVGGWLVCPIVLHVVAWVLANSALQTIRASGGTVGGDGLAKAARIIAIVGLVFYGVGILFFVFVVLAGLLSMDGGVSATGLSA